MTDEEAEILELRFENRNLKEELLLSQAECKKYEAMFLTLGERYETCKRKRRMLWEEYCKLEATFKD